MPFYLAAPLVVTSSAGEDAGAELPGGAGMVAVRLADLVCPAGAGLGKDGRSALVVAGAGKVGTGDLVVFLKPVAVAAAVVRQDGRVQAAIWRPLRPASRRLLTSEIFICKLFLTDETLRRFETGSRR